MKNWFIRLFWRGAVVPIEIPHVCNMRYLQWRSFPRGTKAQCPVCAQKWKLINISPEFDFTYFRTERWVKVNE